MAIQLDSLPDTRPSRLEMEIAELRRLPPEMFRSMLSRWEHGIGLLWRRDTAEKLAGLGTDAASLFAHSAAMAAFLESQVSGCTAKAMAMLKPFTIHEDGSVTLDPQ